MVIITPLRKNKKDYNMKIILNRMEIDEAIKEYIEKLGLKFSECSVKLGLQSTTISLSNGEIDIDLEDELEDEAELEQSEDTAAEVEEPVVEEPVVKEPVAEKVECPAECLISGPEDTAGSFGATASEDANVDGPMSFGFAQDT